MGVWDLLDSILRFVPGRRMPVTREQIAPYARFRNELTLLFRTFRVVRQLCPNTERRRFIEYRKYLKDTNQSFYGELTNIRSLLDETHLEIFDDLIKEIFWYLHLLQFLENNDIEFEKELRRNHLNHLEEVLYIKFVESEYAVRKFLLGFSFKAWWKMRKIRKVSSRID